MLRSAIADFRMRMAVFYRPLRNVIGSRNGLRRGGLRGYWFAGMSGLMGGRIGRGRKFCIRCTDSRHELHEWREFRHEHE